MVITSCCTGGWLLPGGGSVVIVSVVTTCWADVCSLSLALAWRRSRWTEAKTSACWFANA
jgi:hypothetical protein